MCVYAALISVDSLSLLHLWLLFDAAAVAITLEVFFCFIQCMILDLIAIERIHSMAFSNGHVEKSVHKKLLHMHVPSKEVKELRVNGRDSFFSIVQTFYFQ